MQPSDDLVECNDLTTIVDSEDTNSPDLVPVDESELVDINS